MQGLVTMDAEAMKAQIGLISLEKFFRDIPALVQVECGIWLITSALGLAYRNVSSVYP